MTDQPRKRFRFDYEPTVKDEASSTSVDDIVESLNRDADAREVLYPGRAQYYSGLVASQWSGDRQAGRGKLVFGLMLAVGMLVIWFYGDFEKIFQLSMLDMNLPVFGRMIPVWMVAGGVVVLLGLARVLAAKATRKPEILSTH